MDCEQNYYTRAFSHIYIEKRVWDHPRTQEICAQFPNAQRIEIGHYKEVFNRRGQDYREQHSAQSLILAAETERFFYEGAKPCQDFGNDNFYYCSAMKNCIFDCSYCYLKGMYPSGNLVIYVNLEDYFAALAPMLEEKSIYLCVSYDADLLALESLVDYGALWADFAKTHPNLTLEIRTKSARMEMWEQLPVISNVIYAFTLSPEAVIAESERGTPSASARIRCALRGLRKGFPVRFCFDPMLYLPTWREDYAGLMQQLDDAFAQAGCSFSDLTDVSIGGFRISQDYMKKMRKVESDSIITQFPYTNVEGIYRYPPELLEEMENYIQTELAKRMPEERVYRELEG